MRVRTAILFLFTLFHSPILALADDEVSLFDSSGKPVAYIALDDELTIYLWSGTPVAYVDREGGQGAEVYGFNGKQLGWFANNAIFDKSGNVSCATKERLLNTQFEPFKSFRKFKPLQSLKQLGSLKPLFRNTWSEFPCNFFLAQGSK